MPQLDKLMFINAQWMIIIYILIFQVLLVFILIYNLGYSMFKNYVIKKIFSPIFGRRYFFDKNMLNFSWFVVSPFTSSPFINNFFSFFSNSKQSGIFYSKKSTFDLSKLDDWTYFDYFYNLFSDPALEIQANNSGFQVPGSKEFYATICTHNDIYYILTVILFLVFYFLFVATYNNYKYIQPYHEKLIAIEEYNGSIISERFDSCTLLEIVWTVVPSFILMLIGIPCLSLLYGTDEHVDAEFIVKIIGHQWYWTYEYPAFIDKKSNLPFSTDSSGIHEDDLKDFSKFFDAVKSIKVRNEIYRDGDLLSNNRYKSVDTPLVIPCHRRIHAYITSDDVIHSWAVPALGIKVDACPGRINRISFQADIDSRVYNAQLQSKQHKILAYAKQTDVAGYWGQCSEFCGVGHGFMPISVHAIAEDKYAFWFDLVVFKNNGIKDQTIFNFRFSEHFLKNFIPKKVFLEFREMQEEIYLFQDYLNKDPMLTKMLESIKESDRKTIFRFHDYSASMKDNLIRSIRTDLNSQLGAYTLIYNVIISKNNADVPLFDPDQSFSLEGWGDYYLRIYRAVYIHKFVRLKWLMSDLSNSEFQHKMKVYNQFKFEAVCHERGIDYLETEKVYNYLEKNIISMTFNNEHTLNQVKFGVWPQEPEDSPKVDQAEDSPKVDQAEGSDKNEDISKNITISKDNAFVTLIVLRRLGINPKLQINIDNFSKLYNPEEIDLGELNESELKFKKMFYEQEAEKASYSGDSENNDHPKGSGDHLGDLNKNSTPNKKSEMEEYLIRINSKLGDRMFDNFTNGSNIYEIKKIMSAFFKIHKILYELEEADKELTKPLKRIENICNLLCNHFLFVFENDYHGSLEPTEDSTKVDPAEGLDKNEDVSKNITTSKDNAFVTFVVIRRLGINPKLQTNIDNYHKLYNPEEIDLGELNESELKFKKMFYEQEAEKASYSGDSENNDHPKDSGDHFGDFNKNSTPDKKSEMEEYLIRINSKLGDSMFDNYTNGSNIYEIKKIMSAFFKIHKILYELEKSDKELTKPLKRIQNICNLLCNHFLFVFENDYHGSLEPTEDSPKVDPAEGSGNDEYISKNITNSKEYAFKRFIVIYRYCMNPELKINIDNYNSQDYSKINLGELDRLEQNFKKMFYKQEAEKASYSGDSENNDHPKGSGDHLGDLNKNSTPQQKIRNGRVFNSYKFQVGG